MILVKKQELIFYTEFKYELGKVTYFITNDEFYIKINRHWLYWKDNINELNYDNYEYDENDFCILYEKGENNKFYSYICKILTEEQYNTYNTILKDFNNLENLFDYDFKTKL